MLTTESKEYPMVPDYNDVVDYEIEDNVPRYWFSSRFTVAALGFLGLMSMNLQRTCMSVAMICMINQSAITIPDGTNTTTTSTTTPWMPTTLPYRLPLNASIRNTQQYNRTGSPWNYTIDGPAIAAGCSGDARKLFDMNMTKPKYMYDGEFDWSETRQNIVYGTFYWGYLISQIPSGWLAEKFGGKKIFGFFLLVASGSTMLIPLGSRVNYFIVLLLRIIAGIGAGAAIPSMHAVLGKWAPPLERSKMASIAYSGLVLGGVGTFPATSALCQWEWFDGGWPAVFYIFGGSGVVWFILWMMFISETPHEHGRMAHAERLYMEATLKGHTDNSNKIIHVDWLHLLTSLPFFAIIVSHFCFEFGFFIYETHISQYFVEVIKLDYKTNEFFAMSPYLGIWFCMVVSGIWSDKLRSRGVMQTTAVRKVMQLCGTIVPATMLVGLSFLKCGQWYAAISMLVIGISLTGFQYNGFYVNHLDIAPTYAGIMMGISNTFGALTSFVAPYMIRVINDKFPDDQWKPVFFITAAIYMFGLLVYTVLGRAVLQKWALPPEENEGEKCASSASSVSSSVHSVANSYIEDSAANELDDAYSTEDNLSEASTEPVMDTADESSNPYTEDELEDNDSMESDYQEAKSVTPPPPEPHVPTMPNRRSVLMSDLSESIV